jgi:hypothetical protein
MPSKLKKERNKNAAMMIDEREGCYLHPKLLAMIVSKKRTSKASKRG